MQKLLLSQKFRNRDAGCRTYGIAEAVAAGAREIPGCEVVVKRVPETLSPEILGKMGAIISTHSQELSEYAPRYTTLRINPDKIRDVIGKGGVTIRSITEETGATIDISDDGVVKIAAVDKAAGDEARRRIELITADVEAGQIYEGKVVRLMDFGAFVTILPGRDGMVHVSQICEERVQNVSDKLAVGDVVKVRIMEVDKQGRIRLTMKGLN